MRIIYRRLTWHLQGRAWRSAGPRRQAGRGGGGGGGGRGGGGAAQHQQQQCWSRSAQQAWAPAPLPPAAAQEPHHEVHRHLLQSLQGSPLLVKTVLFSGISSWWANRGVIKCLFTGSGKVKTEVSESGQQWLLPQQLVWVEERPGAGRFLCRALLEMVLPLCLSAPLLPLLSHQNSQVSPAFFLCGFYEIQSVHHFHNIREN